MQSFPSQTGSVSLLVWLWVYWTHPLMAQTFSFPTCEVEIVVICSNPSNRDGVEMNDRCLKALGALQKNISYKARAVWCQTCQVPEDVSIIDISESCPQISDKWLFSLVYLFVQFITQSQLYFCQFKQRVSYWSQLQESSLTKEVIFLIKKVRVGQELPMFLLISYSLCSN